MMTKRLISCVLFILFCFTTQAQEEFYMDGVLPDDGTYDILPAKKELVTKSYEILPSKYSLKQYCPSVKSQSIYSTCTSWATVYAARTIAEAIKYNWDDKEKITGEAFSPLFVYAQIKYSGDVSCNYGTFISDALSLLKETGSPKLYEFNLLCANPDDISLQMKESARKYRIDDWCTLFGYSSKDTEDKIFKVKKSLNENHPVVISMWLDKPTFRETKAVLNLETVDKEFPRKSKEQGEGYHAMCVVGYDDNVYGGAFQIMNSWGTGWGDQGFFWAKYEDFARTVDQAYEFTIKPLPLPKPDPKPEPVPVVLNELAAKVEMKRRNGKEIKPTLDSENDLCYYQLYGEVHSGDSLRMYISNNEQAYVYVFSSDMKNNVNELFPRPYVIKEGGKIERKNYSPALTYRSNYIALPDEKHSILIDDTKGTDYWCVLYSKEALDFDEILDKVKTHKGSFYEKIRFALGDRMVPKKDIRFVMNKIEFGAKSEKAIVPVIIEAVHN